MASLSSAQIRLRGGTSSSSRNLAFKPEPLKSTRVSFGLPPRSSFLTLTSSSSSIRKTANGILPVAARKKMYSVEELERMTKEEAEELGKVMMINGKKYIQLVPPLHPQSEVPKIVVEEAAQGETKETDNHGAAKTLSDEYEVGDYIKTRIRKDNVLVEGVVVKKEDNGLTLLEKEKADGMGMTVYALANDELVGWTEFDVKQRSSGAAGLW